jgi:hypothetical protein
VARALEVLRPHADQPVEEALVQGWVDACYAPIAAAWTADVARIIDDKTRDIVEANRPLRSDEALLKQFDELFEFSREVVPASLADAYEKLLTADPLAAGGLVVPISNGQWHRLKRANLLETRTAAKARFDVAAVPYEKTRGLALDAVKAGQGD